MDKHWRARTARELKPILEQASAAVLDTCCGTGDLAFSLARRGEARIFGADFSHTMLVRAREKSAGQRSGKRAIPFLEADALRLPFADSSFDLVTSAFGFRNLANYEAGLQEIYRVLKPGSTIAILEFTEPAPGLMGDLYQVYCQKILPKIGGWISGDGVAYAYLPKSVARFFRPLEFVEQLQRVGYVNPRYQLMTFGSVALHVAARPR